MPAFKFHTKAVFLCFVLLLLMVPTGMMADQGNTSPQAASSLSRALAWLDTKQADDGSFGGLYSEAPTASAAYALSKYGSSSRADTAFAWLASGLDNSSYWFWDKDYGEADVPGLVLYALGESGQSNRLQNSAGVFSRLLQFRQTNGGFAGYYDSGAHLKVTSSVDTALGVMALAKTGISHSSSFQAELNYLFGLQKNDGSFNLTRTVSSDPLYSLGPEPISLTALVTLAFSEAGLKREELHVSSALNFLKSSSSSGLSGHVYAISLSSLAFNSFNLTTDASKTLAQVLFQQGSDGGFRDVSRSGNGSNSLDTGWAAVALETVRLSSPQMQSPWLPVLPFVELVGLVLGVGLAAVLGIVVLMKSRRSRVTANQNIIFLIELSLVRDGKKDRDFLSYGTTQLGVRSWKASRWSA